MHFKPNSLIKVSAVLVVTAFLFTGCGKLEGNKSAKSVYKEVAQGDVSTEKVKKGDISAAVQSTGELMVAKSEGLYYNDISGTLKKVRVMLGDNVSEGQAIVDIDVRQIKEDIKTRELEIRLSELKNQQNDQAVINKKASIAKLEKEKEKAEKDYAKQATEANRSNLDRINSQIADAKNDLKTAQIYREMDEVKTKLAKNEYQKLRNSASNGTLVSPGRGRIVFLDSLYEGEQIDSSRVLARLARPSDMVFQIVTTQTKNLLGNFDASLVVNGKKYPVEIYKPKPGDQLQQNNEVKNKVYLSFKDSVPKIDFNEPVPASLEITKSRTLTIPRTSIRDELGKKVVDVLKKDSVETVEVVTGIENDDRVEILSGLSEGDEVLVK
jgi:multidrug efflux pump subunit AcrA (membrane-fusion protein)